MIRVFTSKTQEFGQRGEEEAVVWLKNQGFSILERNVSLKYGEIDIVAQKERTVYFFEVKAGRSTSWLTPAENLTSAKLGKFLKSVSYYCLVHGIHEYRAEAIIVVLGKAIMVERIELF